MREKGDESRKKEAKRENQRKTESTKREIDESKKSVRGYMQKKRGGGRAALQLLLTRI